MSLTVGTRLGPYEIVAPIGAGGMGEVYRARDTKLNRDVAIKVLPEDVAADPDRLARFEREAQVLAALNHPNIAAVYAVEDRAIVMELVAGEDLSARIQRGPIPLTEALPLARQIVDALSAAHEAGIIHRDLKPANIKVKDDGTVKVLDFGLAKALDPPGESSAERMNSPTLTARATRMGVILGTAAYMAPEQARGKALDRRADIWAFGVVLYEMLTGRRPFEGDDVTDVLAAVVRAEPDWTALPANVPPLIRRMLVRCLTKDIKQRLHDIADAGLEIEEAVAGPVGGTVEALSGNAASQFSGLPRRMIAWAVLGSMAVGLVAGVATWLAVRRPPSDESVVQFDERVVSYGSLNFALSSDGARLAYVFGEADGQSRLWIRSLSEPEATAVPGTEGASFPFWSPTGDSLGYFAGGKLKVMTLRDGASRVLCDAPNGRGGTWGGNNTIVFAPEGQAPLSQISADAADGRAVAITALNPSDGETSHRFPQFLADGVNFIFFAQLGNNRRGKTFMATVGRDGREFVLDTDDSADVHPGAIVYTRDRVLRRRGWEPGNATLGPEEVVVSNLNPPTLYGQRPFSTSPAGTLAYVPSILAFTSRLAWFTARGALDTTIGVRGAWQDPDLNASGDSIAVATGDSIHVLDSGTGALRRPPLAGTASDPDWSPDGRYLVVLTRQEIHRRPLGQSETDTLFQEPGAFTSSPALSPRGTFLVFSKWNGATDFDIVALSLDADGRPKGKFVPVTSLPGSQQNPRVAPNERWVAFVSSAAARQEVFVQAFPDSRAPTKVSTADGSRPRWRPGSSELFFVEAGHKLMRVVVSDDPSIGPGLASTVFDLHADFPGSTIRGYDVAADGRFLVSVGDPPPPTSIRIILNWPALVTKQGR